MTTPVAFDAFLSYSRKDLRFAVELERALERYTPPREIRTERRPIAVCRDQDDLTGPEYHAAIESHLTRSKKLILICSPRARASEFVNDEIRRFAAIHGADGIVPVLLAGVPNNAAREGDAENLAFPDALCELVAMPLAISYTGFEPDRDRVTKGVFYGAWYTLLATLLDVDRAAIEERDRHRKARVRNSWIGGTSGVIAALSALTIWAVVERNTAIRRGQISLAQRLAAQAGTSGPLEPDAAERRTMLGVEAVRRLEALGEPTYDAASALRTASALVARHVVHLNTAQRVVVFSGDGLSLFSAEGPNVSVHSLRSGARTVTINAPGPIDDLFASADSRTVGAVAGGRLSLWRAPKWEAVRSGPEVDSGRVLCAALTADGRYLAALALDRPPLRSARLLVWQTDSARIVAQTRLTLPSESVVRPVRDECLQIGMDHVVARYRSTDTSTTLAAAVWEWRPASATAALFGRGTRAISPPREWRDLTQVAWTGDSNAIVLLGNGSVTSVALASATVDVRTSDKPISRASANGEVLVRTRWEEDPYVPLLKSWMFTAIDRRSNAERGVVAETSDEFALSPDGATMVTAAGTRMRLWRTQDGRELMRMKAPAPVVQLTVSRGSRYVAGWDSFGAVDIWDVGHPSELLRVPTGRVAAVSADAGRIAIGTPLGVTVVDAVTGHATATIPIGGGAGFVALSGDGRYLVASGGDPRGFNFGAEPLRSFVLDLSRGPDTLFAGTQATAAAFTPDGKVILFGTTDSTVRAIDLAKRAVLWEKRFDGGRATRFVFSTDGRVAAVALEPPVRSNSVVVALSTQTGAELRRVLNRETNALAISSDGSELATAARGLVEVTRVADGTIVTRLTHPSTLETVRQIAFLPGNRMMSVAGSLASMFFGASFFTEQAVFVWNRATATVEQRIPEGADRAGEYSTTLVEENKPYFSEIAWSPNGTEVAAVVFSSRLNYWVVPAALTSSELRVWRLGASAPEEVFRESYEGAPRILGLDDRAGMLLTADDAVRAWSYRPRELIDETCRRITRSFSATEWKTLINADERPRATCTNASPRSQ